MITRRQVLMAGGASMVVVHRLSHGQPAATLRRVGVLWLASEAGIIDPRVTFTQGMQDLGWREGQNVEYRFVYANGDADRLDALASELVGQKVEVIVVSNARATRAAQRATKTIPIVMAGVSNAVGNGFVASLARPGGNITGIVSQLDEVLGKLIGILHEVTPGARRVAIMLNEGNPNHPAFWVAAQRACVALDLIALRVVASTPAQFGAAVGEIVRQRSQAVVVPGDPISLIERAKLQALMQPTRLPVAYQFRENVVAGGLLSYSADQYATFRPAARYVDKILMGAKPADLPVEQPTKFELVLNARTAKALGITFPQALLLRADEVIQ